MRSFAKEPFSLIRSAGLIALFLWQTQTPVFSQDQKIETTAPTIPVDPVKEKNEDNSDENVSLEELLKTEVPQLTKENAATKNLWDRLVEAISKNQFDAADGYATSLLNTKDILTPIRLEFCLLYNELSKKDDATPGTASTTLYGITEIDQKNEKLELEKQLLLEERPVIYKKIEDRNKSKATSAIIGSLVGAGLGAGLGAAAGGGDGAAIGAGAGAAAGAAGGYGLAAATTPEVRLEYIEKRLQEINSEKLGLEAERKNLQDRLTGEEKQKEVDQANARKDIRDRVVRLMETFMGDNEFQPAAALANAYLKLRGMDSLVSLKCSEIYREQAKVSQITKVAKVIRNKIEKIFGTGPRGLKPWTALAELEKMEQMTKNKFHDLNQLKVLEKELFEINEKLQTTRTDAEKQRIDCLSQGKQDADSALKQLEIYANTYTDDPDYQKTLIELKKLQTEQVERKVAKQMAAVEETIANDPEKAKDLLQGLLAQELPELEKALLDGKISAAFKRIYENEIQLVRADVDEAQGYLEKYTLETGADRALVDLSSLHDKFQDLQLRGNQADSQSKSMDGGFNTSTETASNIGGGIAIPFLGVSGLKEDGSKNELGISGSYQGKKRQSKAFSAQSTNSDKGANNRLFSFTGRLLIGTENINRALSLLEGGFARAKKIQQDPNLNKVLGGRMEGLCKSIEVSLEQLKEFRKKEDEARRWTWIFMGIGLSLIAVFLILILLKIKKMLSPAA